VAFIGMAALLPLEFAMARARWGKYAYETRMARE
jgi:hypothetical protein